MNNYMAPFEKPIFITSPMCPSVKSFTEEYKKIKKSKWLSNFGKNHNLLENKLAEYLRVHYLSLYNNGTTALISAIKALSLTGEIITSPFTFPASVDAIMWNGLKPVFCDISPNDYNIDTNRIEELITSKTSAILAIHAFGNPCNYNATLEIAKKYNLKIIYDAAHAFGVSVDNIPIATLGDISAFSFHATKIFNTIEGGCLCCQDSKLSRKIKLIRNFGINNEMVEFQGLNGKLNELQSSFGLLNLKKIDQEIKLRKNLTKIYYDNLKEIEGISILLPQKNVKYNYQYLIINVSQSIDRDYIHEKLKEYNVFTKKYFYPCVNKYKFLTDAKHDIKTAKKASKETLALPLYGELTESDVEKICRIIKRIVTSKKSMVKT